MSGKVDDVKDKANLDPRSRRPLFEAWFLDLASIHSPPIALSHQVEIGVCTELVNCSMSVIGVEHAPVISTYCTRYLPPIFVTYLKIDMPSQLVFVSSLGTETPRTVGSLCTYVRRHRLLLLYRSSSIQLGIQWLLQSTQIIDDQGKLSFSKLSTRRNFHCCNKNIIYMLNDCRRDALKRHRSPQSPTEQVRKNRVLIKVDQLSDQM